MKDTQLLISHCSAYVGEKQILDDVSVTFQKGSVTVIMGPNGSGKSTLAHVIMGDPTYSYQSSAIRQETKNKKFSIVLCGKNIADLPTEERAKLGLFLSFQSPVAIPGVSVIELLRSSYEGHIGKTNVVFKDFLKMVRTHAETLHIAPELLTRGIHEGFSGGERKKIELLQALVLKPSFAIFDEIDTGLDVDALRIVGKGIQALQKIKTGIVIITHNQKILSYVVPDTVIVMDKGKVVKTGNAALAKIIDEKGFTYLNHKSQ